MDSGGMIDRVTGATTDEGQSASQIRPECSNGDAGHTGGLPSRGSQAQIQRFFKPSGIPTITPISSLNSLHSPEDDILQYTYHTSASQQPSHGNLAFRPIDKPESQNSQRNFDKIPYANSTEETMKRYDESSSELRAIGREGGDKRRHPGLLDAPSPPVPATKQAGPSTLSAPIDKVRIGNGVSNANSLDSKPHSPDYKCLLHCLIHNEGQRTLAQSGSEPNRSNSRQSECRPSKGASRTNQNGTIGKRKRSLGIGGNGEVPNDENDDGDDSTRRTSNKRSAEYLKKGFACPFYKNDPVYFAKNLFHDGKFLICAARGFPDIARLKEHLYRKHSLPHTCSRCGEIFKNKSALDSHLPVRYPEKITCDVQTLPSSKTKGLTPDMEGELKKRFKKGASSTAEAIWNDIYKKLFPGDPIPPSGAYLTDSHGFSCASCGIKGREEYIQYSEQELPRLVQEELDTKSCVEPEHGHLLISVMKSCQKKLRRSFQERENSGAGPAWENSSPESICRSNETVREMIPVPFQPDSEIVNHDLEEPPLPISQLIGSSTTSPDLLFIYQDSGYDSASRCSKSINHSRSGSDPLVDRSSLQFASGGGFHLDTSEPSNFDFFLHLDPQSPLQPLDHLSWPS